MSNGAQAGARARVLRLIKAHGWNATSFQVLESHFRYWFVEDRACVAFVDTGKAWVAAGAPIAPEGELGAVAEQFVGAAAEQGRRACFFGVEQRFVRAAGMASLHMGEQPSWDPAQWEGTLRGSRSLREQLRRARAKGVAIRGLEPAELEANTPVRREVEALCDRWLASRGMPPMRFLVELEPFAFLPEKRFWIAELEGAVVGFLAAVPIFQRSGWFLEDLVRDTRAPNGTAELLIDAALRAAAGDGSRYVTLGLVPLAGAIGIFLRAARALGQGLYDFEGLRRFKLKLKPASWSPIYLALPRGQSRWKALRDVLTAFAGESLVRFGWRTLWRGPAFFVQILAALLIPWTLAIALSSPGYWFPSRSIWAGWIGFDAVLCAALFALAGRWRRWLGALLASAVTLDAALTTAEAVSFNLPRVARFSDVVVVAIAVLAPSTAAGFLWRVQWEKSRAARRQR